jgi:hypothetical protein
MRTCFTRGILRAEAGCESENGIVPPVSIGLCVMEAKRLILVPHG